MHAVCSHSFSPTSCGSSAGKWLDVNGEAIYSTKPWDVCQNETESSVFYTKTKNRLFAHFTQWPADQILGLRCPIATPDT
jgi:alpha-L-fucosidase